MNNKFSITINEVFSIINILEKMLPNMYLLTINNGFYLSQYHRYLKEVEEYIYDVTFQKTHGSDVSNSVWEELLSSSIDIEPFRYTFTNIINSTSDLSDDELDTLENFIRRCVISSC